MTTNAIVPIDETGRRDWKALVKATLAKAANPTDTELEMFAQVSNHLGLDPWRREVYAIRYGQNNPISFVIGIDGFLRKAAETGLYDGQDSILYAGPDGKWTELWVDDGPPFAAKATVYRKGSSHSITYIAHYKSAKRESPLWKSQPDIQLGINALKHALRRGFGDAFGELDKQLTTLRSEGVRVVDEDTGEIFDALADPNEEQVRADFLAEHSGPENAHKVVQLKGNTAPVAERPTPTVAPPQPRKETPGSVGDLSTRFWTIAKARGTAFYEPWLQKHFGSTSFELLDEDEQRRAVEALEKELG